MPTVEMELAGRSLRIETGSLAKQASGSVMVRYADTMVLVACVGSQKPREGIDFFPLTVDYEEKLYAAGKIPGSWFRKEGRPTEKCILTSRLIDRSIRPLFPKGWKNEVQIITSVMSADQENDPDISALIGASAALVLSDVPFLGPVGAVRLGRIQGKLVINPTTEQREKSDLDLVVAGTAEAVTMIEAGAREISESEMFQAVQFAHGIIKEICAKQEELRKTCGKPKREVPGVKPDPELREIMRKHFTPEINRIFFAPDKKEREAGDEALNRETLLKILEEYPEEVRERVKTILEDPSRVDYQEIKKELWEEKLRDFVVVEKRRPDGRKFDEIRPLSSSVGFLPRTHGSALFTRGQTQVVATITLGGPSEEQSLDGLLPEETKHFLLHYYFPPYSVGEVKPMRGPGRREIGHGALAERALSYLLPSIEEFPYTIRVVCEAVESNGSTSMASVCSGSLALFDAGVPLKKAVAGIAMGLVHRGNEYAVLTDIQGLEDFLGEMDFKIAGTREGITAIQLDTKLTGIEMEILEKALYQAQKARLQLLATMNQAIPLPRADLSPYAPRVLTLTVPTDKIKDVIGPGGKMINRIIEKTGVKIDIEDDGRIFIVTPNLESAEAARKLIEDITRDAEVGKVYPGRVSRISTFGAFVELFPGKEGLLHISKIGPGRIRRVEDVLQVGDEISVEVLKIDEQGRVDLIRPGSSREESSSPRRERDHKYSGSGPQRRGRDGDRRHHPSRHSS